MGLFGSLSLNQQNERTLKFKRVAQELSNTFPSLDLRFNMREGSAMLRVAIPDISSQVVQMSLDSGSIHELIVQASFELKRLAQRFDA